MRLIDFNVNDAVHVRLTHAGRKLHAKHWRSYNIDPPEIEEDAEGYSRWQLWELMSVFGSAMFNGQMELPFATGIRFETSENGSVER